MNLLHVTDVNIEVSKNIATSFSFQEPVKSKSTILLFIFIYYSYFR